MKQQKTKRGSNAAGALAADTAAVTAAPPTDEALTALLRRTVRAWAWLLVRVVTLALLLAILSVQSPWVRQNRALMDALSGILALWPFFTAMGRIYSWRIALGRSYVREERWADAERTLSPLPGYRARLFDATGEGTYWLAVAHREQGKTEEARRLFRMVTERQPGGEWSQKAQEALAPQPVSTDAKS